MQMAHAQSIHATSLQSALCSPDALVLTFNAPLSDGDVTRVEISDTAEARLKYELDLLPGVISGSVLTLTPSTEAQLDIRKDIVASRKSGDRDIINLTIGFCKLD